MILTFVYTTLKKLDINIWLFNLKVFTLHPKSLLLSLFYNRVWSVKRLIIQYKQINFIKMKKILMTLAVAFVAVAANAQVYVGGSVGIASSKQNGGKNVTTYQVLPEIGYNINKDVALGTVVGWGKGNPVNIQNESRNYFTIQPYARFNVVRTKYVDAFIDGGFGYTHYNHAYAATPSINEWSVGLKPGIAVNLNKKVSLVAHVGFAGWKSAKYDGASKDSHVWGVSLDGNNVNFGVYYNF